MIVVDTNVIAALIMKQQQESVARAVWSLDQEWYAPPLWQSEFRNVLLKYVTRKLVELEMCEAVLREAHRILPLQCLVIPDDLHVMRIAASSGCTAYDAEFVVVAESLDSLLLTWDKKLLASFPGRAILPEHFVSR